MRVIAGAIVTAAGALLYGMMALAESAVRAAETQRGTPRGFALGEGGYVLAWLLVLVGLIILGLDIGPPRTRAKPPEPAQRPE